METQDLERLEKEYRSALLDDCIPFWLKHSLDRECGGYFHQLDFDGSVYDTDKYMWPQGREIWVFSMLYRQIEKRPEWLEAAKLGVDFIKEHGRDENGDWYFALDRYGTPIIAPYNIFSDFFAVMAFAEYGLAAGDEEAIDTACATFERIQARKANPKGRYEKRLPGAPKLKGLGLPMINLGVALTLKQIEQIEKKVSVDALIEECVRDIMSDFLDDGRGIVFENAGPAGEHPDTMLGRHVVPGHGIEGMWFIMRAAGMMGDDKTVRRAAEVTLSTIDFAWDGEYDGLYYFMDAAGGPHFELQWDMKLWWVHLETLIATLMGYHFTGEEALLHAFMKIHDYSWKRFPDPEHGEWFGYLNRQGQVNNRCKSNRWKCCFHLPRALFEVAALLAQIRDQA